MQQLFMRRLLGASGDLHGLYEWTTPGTYTFKLLRRTKAKLIIVGSGMNRTNLYPQDSSWWTAGSGGGCFIGRVILPAGNYTFILNKSECYTNGSSIAATTNINYFSNETSTLISVGTQLTISNNLEIIPGSVEMESNGNSARVTQSGRYLADTGGASLYNGYGKGSDYNTSNCTTGYFKLEW